MRIRESVGILILMFMVAWVAWPKGHIAGIVVKVPVIIVVTIALGLVSDSLLGLWGVALRFRALPKETITARTWWWQAVRRNELPYELDRRIGRYLDERMKAAEEAVEKAKVEVERLRLRDAALDKLKVRWDKIVARLEALEKTGLDVTAIAAKIRSHESPPDAPKKSIGEIEGKWHPILSRLESILSRYEACNRDDIALLKARPADLAAFHEAMVGERWVTADAIMVRAKWREALQRAVDDMGLHTTARVTDALAADELNRVEAILQVEREWRERLAFTDALRVRVVAFRADLRMEAMRLHAAVAASVETPREWRKAVYDLEQLLKR